MKIKLADFTLKIPASSETIARRVKVKVPVEWDESIGEWMMTPEALRIAEETKAREMGIIPTDPRLKSARPTPPHTRSVAKLFTPISK